MKSIKQQYIDLREGNMTQANFMRNLRMSLPQYVTNLSSFEDSVRILKNKGILTEADIKMISIEKEDIEDNIDTEKETSEDDMLSNVSIGRAEISNRANPKDGFSLGFFEEGLDGSIDANLDSLTDELDATQKETIMSIIKKMLRKGASKLNTSVPQGVPTNPKDPYDVGYDIMGGVSETLRESISDDEIMKKYNEMIGKNPQTKFADVAKALNIPEDQVASALQSGAMPKFGLREAKDEKGKWTNANGKSMYDQFKEIDNLNGHEVAQGIDWEMQCNPDMSKRDIVKKVIKNLKKNPIYYTAWDMSGVEGYEPEYMSKSSKPEDWQMQPLDKNMGNVVDKKMGMQPVKGIEKPKKDSDKGGEVNKTVKGVELMSLIAKTVRGMKKMDATGEKMKKISVRENKEESKSGINYHNLKTSDQATRAKKIYDEEERKRKEKNDSSLKNKLKELIRKELKEYEVGDESYKLNDLEAAQAVVDNLIPNLEGDTFTESELQNSFTTTEDQMGQRFNDEVFDLAIELLGQDGYTIEGLTDLGELSYGDNMTDVAGHQFD